MSEFAYQFIRKSNPRVGYFFLSLFELALGSWFILPMIFSIVGGWSVSAVTLVEVFFGANLAMLGGVTLYATLSGFVDFRNRTGQFHIFFWSFMSMYSMLGGTFDAILLVPSLVATVLAFFMYLRVKMEDEK